MNLLNLIFVDPIFNALIFFYNIFGDIGLAIIAITLTVRIALMPLSSRAFKAQRKLQALQPELKRLQDKHKDDKETLSKELMAFYKREGVSPTSSCLPTLIQIPILITLYVVFRDAITGQHLDSVYSFIQQPSSIDPNFLGINLSSTGAHPANIILAVITGGLQFVQSKMLMPKDGATTGMNRQIMYIFPVLTFVFALTLPAALPLYWATSTLFMIVQQYVIIKNLPLREARVEATAEWNEANPADTVGKGKAALAPQVVSGKTTKRKGGAEVTIRKRGE